jgi:hypothetical protein
MTNEFEVALNNHRAAKMAVDSHKETAAKWNSVAGQIEEMAFDDLVKAECEAMDKLIATPCGSAEALVEKCRYIAFSRDWEDNMDEYEAYAIVDSVLAFLSEREALKAA